MGISKANRTTIWGSGGNSSDEFAQKIILPDTNSTYFVKRVYIGASRFYPGIPMVLHIYTLGADGKPDVEILQDKILFTKEDFNRKQQRFSIDLMPYKIYLKRLAVYVGVEWLPVLKRRAGCTAIILTGDLPEELTFVRSTYFLNFPTWGPTFKGFSKTVQSNPNNTIISIEVDILK